jgi:aspartate aminotransferase-like enzyme
VKEEPVEDKNSLMPGPKFKPSQINKAAAENKKKSLSMRFSEVDFQKQLKSMQDTKNQATALTKSSSMSNALRETLLLPSLSHRAADCDELNPGIYTTSYKHRIRDLSA